MAYNKWLNKQSGNMYPWIDRTWTPIAGECKNKCIYCYTRYPPITEIGDKYEGELRLAEKALEGRMPEGETIFACSTSDLFQRDMDWQIIQKILLYMSNNNQSKYLIQTKNPTRMVGYKDFFEIGIGWENIIFGITLESNRTKPRISNASFKKERYMQFSQIKQIMPEPEYMVSIEPIMDLDVKTMLKWMRELEPDFVSIGADSRTEEQRKEDPIPEPDREKVIELKQNLSRFTEVKAKKNLDRLL